MWIVDDEVSHERLALWLLSDRNAAWVVDADQWTVEGTDDEDEETGLNVDPSFEEVPSGWLERCRWNVSGFGRWTRREDVYPRLGSKSVDEMRGALI